MQANYLCGTCLGRSLQWRSKSVYRQRLWKQHSDSGQRPKSALTGYGNADYDTRHSINGNYVYEIPKGPTPALKGWQLSGTVFWRTGFPYTPFNNGAQGILSGNGFGGPVFANYTVAATALQRDFRCIGHRNQSMHPAFKLPRRRGGRAHQPGYWRPLRHWPGPTRISHVGRNRNGCRDMPAASMVKPATSSTGRITSIRT